MKNSSLSLFTLSLLMLTKLANAAAGSIDPSELSNAYGPFTKSAACAVDARDPFDPAYEISYGEYKGKCIDASTVRPPIVVAEDDQKIELANFYHNGRYWIASVPKNAVTKVIFQGVPFGSDLFGLVITAHGQFRFELNRPIELRSQSGDVAMHDTLRDFIISSTATHPKGISYSVFKGSDFGITTRVLSTTSRAVEEVSQDKSEVHQYLLTMSPENENKFLLVSLRLASEEGYMERYKILAENCATRAFEALDAAIPRPAGVPPFRGHWWEIHDEIEKPSLKALEERHISFERIQNLNDEVECALPGQSLHGQRISSQMLGAASAQCEFK